LIGIPLVKELPAFIVSHKSGAIGELCYMAKYGKNAKKENS
jgi:hypothetical protein